MAQTDRPLDDAYLSAVYRLRWADAEEAFTFARGGVERPRAFAAILVPEPWTLLTAWNPMSRPLPEGENRQRDARLASDLRALGVRAVRSVSCSADGSWTEPGYVASGLGRERALDLGRGYDQRAVVFASGGRVGLLYPRTERWSVRAIYRPHADELGCSPDGW